MNSNGQGFGPSGGYGPGGPPPPFGPTGGPPPPSGAPWPTPPSPPPARRGRAGLVIGLVVLPLLLVAGAAGFVAHQAGLFGSEESSTTDTSESFDAATYGIAGERVQDWATEAPSGSTLHMTRMLVGEETVARIANNKITGYDLDTGSPRWTITVDPGLTLCAATPETENNIGAVLFRYDSDGPCTNAVAIDLKAGKQLWHKALQPDSTRAGPLEDAIGISEGLVVAGSVHAPVVLDARTGRELWRGDPQFVGEDQRQLSHVTVRRGRVVAAYAGNSEQPEALILHHYGKDGTVLEKLSGPPVEANSLYNEVLFISTDPMVVQMPKSSTSQEHGYFAHDDKKWTKLQTDQVQDKSARAQSLQHGVVAGGTFVKSFTVDDSDLSGDSDTMIAGFDLATGKVSWQYALKRGRSSALFLPGADDDTVTAVVSDYDTGLQLFAFPLNGAEAVRGGQVTASDSGPDFSSASRVAVQGDRLIVFAEVAEGEKGLLGAFSPKS